MSTPMTVLAAIPDQLLFVHDRGPTARLARARDLAQWLIERRCRPTFAELDDERRRRRTDYPSTTPERQTP